MAAQPQGTVTLLFTDIEDSTRLLAALGRERYADALDTHRRLLRAAFERHQGYEVDHEGDSFFVAFPSAERAVQAAVETQEALDAQDWPDGHELRVRIGIHTGEPLAQPPKYVGLDVHRAARIMAAGHGGQVLLSETTARLVEVEPPPLDLGLHRLKDFEQPVRLYQLGEGEFPPLKSLNQSNLPLPATPFLGREHELAELLALLHREDVRLLTLTGPGGTGKTRLALEAGSELVPDFADGVFWVSLAAIREPALVEPTIAQTLDLREAPGEDLANTLARYLEQKRMLLLIDNFEQVVEAAPRLTKLLSACPKVKLLVTSRARLRVSAERVFDVPPLTLPDATQVSDPDVLIENEAVALVLARAQAVKPEFALTDENAGAVAEICRRLDGLPLALELAAARVGILTPHALLKRLDQRLKLLTGGARDADERQRTLRGTIEWSYDLLDRHERILFERLSVFAGGCTLEAAEAVCDPEGAFAIDLLDGLTSLAEKSLLRTEEMPDGEPRFWMLETIREYAAERLEEDAEAQRARRRHAEHFLTLAERAEPELRGPDQRGWLERLELDHDNLRAALSWSREAGDAELGLRLAAALWKFWRTHNHLAEGTRVLETLLKLGEAAPASLRARALLGASRLAMDQGEAKRSVARAEEALVAARSAGTAQEIAAATENLALMMIDTQVTSRAIALLEDSIARYRALGDPVGTADALNNLANALLVVGETARAAQAGGEALALQRGAENAVGIAFVLNTLGYVALHEGDLELARARLEECLILFQELGDLSAIGDSLEGLAHIAAGRGDDRRAVVLWAAGESIRAEAGGRMQPTEAAIHEDALSLVRIRLGEAAVAAAWVEGAALAPEEAVAYALP